MYLGDRHIARARKSYRLQIHLHTRNGDGIQRVAKAITTPLTSSPIARCHEVARLDARLGYTERLL